MPSRCQRAGRPIATAQRRAGGPAVDLRLPARPRPRAPRGPGLLLVGGSSEAPLAASAQLRGVPCQHLGRGLGPGGRTHGGLRGWGRDGGGSKQASGPAAESWAAARLWYPAAFGLFFWGRLSFGACPCLVSTQVPRQAACDVPLCHLLCRGLTGPGILHSWAAVAQDTPRPSQPHRDCDGASVLLPKRIQIRGY